MLMTYHLFSESVHTYLIINTDLRTNLIVQQSFNGSLNGTGT